MNKTCVNDIFSFAVWGEGAHCVFHPGGADSPRVCNMLQNVQKLQEEQINTEHPQNIHTENCCVFTKYSIYATRFILNLLPISFGNTNKHTFFSEKVYSGRKLKVLVNKVCLSFTKSEGRGEF